MRAALAVVFALAAAAIMLLPGSATAQDVRCDRACLESLADLYVTAVAAHDPSRLPLAATVKFTENGQRLQLGDGLWNTATGAGGYALHIADVELGQSVLMARSAKPMRRPSSCYVSPWSGARSPRSRRS